ncbi:hypothetical protein AXX17_AT5G50190 [Arabidopsis thaliana]|uniref:Uncharacterized protein n=1 Tax=Arabidopsis thaliana TaxID=3702 RepID=A0A178U975_ARATH|nr:hypothetical protein AXX17_AT5G50190 [Arabidopsis thaliana]
MLSSCLNQIDCRGEIGKKNKKKKKRQSCICLDQDLSQDYKDAIRLCGRPTTQLFLEPQYRPPKQFLLPPENTLPTVLL